MYVFSKFVSLLIFSGWFFCGHTQVQADVLVEGNPLPPIPSFPLPQKADLLVNALEEAGVSRERAKDVLEFWQNSDILNNFHFITLIDFRLHSATKRMYVLDTENISVEKFLTAHGKNSDRDDDGYATDFSDKLGSKKSSLGFYLTLGTYYGKHGLSLRLKGLSSTNASAYERWIVLHGARYTNSRRTHMGRSWGCPTVARKYARRVVKQLKGGSLIYAFY